MRGAWCVLNRGGLAGGGENLVLAIRRVSAAGAGAEAASRNRQGSYEPFVLLPLVANHQLIVSRHREDAGARAICLGRNDSGWRRCSGGYRAGRRFARRSGPSQSFRCTTARWSAGISPSAEASAARKARASGSAAGAKSGAGLPGQLLVILLACAAPADEVNGQVMRQPQQEGPLVAHACEQLGAFGQLDEQLLKQVTRIRLMASEIEQEREQRLRVFIV